MIWTPFQEKRHFSDIAESSTQLINFQGKRVWATRLSKKQRKNLNALSSIYQEKACDIGLDVCLVDSETQRQGIIIRFLENRPATLKSDQEWFSGFINPDTGAVYDLIGRGYTSNPSNAPKSIYFEQN
jgi:hypothetical protein